MIADVPFIFCYTVLEQFWSFCVLGKTVGFDDIFPLVVGPIHFDAAHRATGWVPTIPADVVDTC